MYNVLVVLANLAAVNLIPLLFYIAVIWSLLQINVINSDVYAPVYQLSDIFNSSYYSFWLSDISGKGLFYTLGALCLLFVIFGTNRTCVFLCNYRARYWQICSLKNMAEVDNLKSLLGNGLNVCWLLCCLHQCDIVVVYPWSSLKSWEISSNCNWCNGHFGIPGIDVFKAYIYWQNTQRSCEQCC